MASYVDSNLSKGEEVIVRAHVSWLSFLITIIVSLFFLFIAFGGFMASAAAKEGEAHPNSVGWVFLFLGLFMLLNVVVKVATTELALTNKRIIAKFGFIRRSTIELRLEKVESISINQGLLGRLLGYGTVVVKGTGGTGTPIPSIKKPLDFRRIVNNFLEEKDTTAQ
ncbi:TPA: PH domain-containing protein [Klebsiella pneumoniae]|uniref:PH domain-containing protein n=1 Tax=Klebsiella pneumoniae complex TaxID=3390273 RepID=UPI00222F81EF|nr:PH domain-containing protein [Klebsiella variicola]MDM9252990.1 PH domain-containing protein [Klebsiella variicola]HCQ8110909.1 PH domain-containing protein [Klebsiella quasipneumoniae subsp. similipneumoniae]HDS3414646.1 PH domain-containing protein [Klebsiella quasipneumoniae]HEG1874764.1 PH domain-containing protein [Enterobacter kobei]